MRRNFMKIGAIAAVMGLIGSPAAGMGLSGAAANAINNINKDAVKGHEIKPTVGSEKRLSSVENVYRHPRTDFSGNQRQYRKKCRQSPCRFNSKKHRSKN